MKEETMNVDTLSRPELLTLLSILEGELEAQDVVVHAIRAQHRDLFVQERYGQYDLSDPFLALQRDSEGVERQLKRAGPHAHPGAGPVGPNPLAVLKLVMAHCKRMQERMMGQLAAAESRHRRVITDLEGEKQRHALVAAQGDDVTLMLKTEREKLLQQLEVERAALRRLEKEQAQVAGQAEESLSHQQELSSALRLELQSASDQAQEEAQRVAQLHSRLQAESATVESLRGALEAEKNRAGQLEARAERQLAKFDTEREQTKAKLSREEEKNRELKREVEELRRRLGGSAGGEKEGREAAVEVKEPLCKVAGAAPVDLVSTSSQTEGDAKAVAVSRAASVSKVNGHHPSREAEPQAENGAAAPQPLPFPPPSHPQSPSSTASSSLSSSPISSPVLAKRLISPVFHQSSYQAGVNQRFHAARHRFQSQAELEQHQQGGSAPLSPRDLSPTTTPVPPSPENSAAKQLARNTVTQVLSRFTSQQAGAKLAPLSSSPFGTDYRSLASPPGGRSPSSSPLSPGIRSPLTPRSEKHQPPALLPKKQGMSPTPASPGPSARTSLFPELTGGCGLSSNGQEDATDLVFSSGS